MGRLNYMPELDGLRAMAVLVVMGLHAGMPMMRCGSIGVDVFFVLAHRQHGAGGGQLPHGRGSGARDAKDPG